MSAAHSDCGDDGSGLISLAEGHAIRMGGGLPTEDHQRDHLQEVCEHRAPHCDVQHDRTGDRTCTLGIGFIALVVLDVLAAVDAEGAGAVAGAIVLNIAVWGAVLAYLLQMVAFVILRRKYPNAKRPFVSPWGVPGAVIAAVIAALIFVGTLVNPTFLPAIIAILVVYVVMLVAFGVWGRHRLILSPEEEYAVSGGLHGDPQAEGYGGAVEEELLASDGVDAPGDEAVVEATPVDEPDKV